MMVKEELHKINYLLCGKSGKKTRGARWYSVNYLQESNSNTQTIELDRPWRREWYLPTTKIGPSAIRGELSITDDEGFQTMIHHISN